MIEVRPTERDDAERLAPNLRQADLDEIKAGSGWNPYLALLVGIDASKECYTATIDGEPVAIFGVCGDENPSVGRIWLLGSDIIKSHRIDFLRKSIEWVKHFQELYPVLYNNIDARNHVHIRWLQWLGFTFIQVFPNYGAEQRPFYQFVRMQSNV